MTGIERIAHERDRQKAEERWHEDHDDRHVHSELALAAVCYAMPPHLREEVPVKAGHLDEGWEACSRSEAEYCVPEYWPWAPNYWRPAGVFNPENRIRELTKAGALIAAEIDRLERLGHR